MISLALLATPQCVRTSMASETGDHDRTADDNLGSERERSSIERTMRAYGTFLRSVERYQQSVAKFRTTRDAHASLHALLTDLAAERVVAAAGRLDVRDAVRLYVRRLRDEDRTPEVALRLTKRTCRAIVLAMPAAESLRNPDTLLDDAVRWAIEAYYEAA
jgi:hypothetical protein